MTTPLKVLNGRVATEEDALTRSVVFYILESRSVPYQFSQELPLLARVVRTDLGDDFPATGTPVVIVQAEFVDTGEVVLGLMYGDYGEAICQLGEVEVIGPFVQPYSSTDQDSHQRQ